MQFLNFAVVPQRARVLFVNCGCLFWNIVLDHLGQKEYHLTEELHSIEENLRSLSSVSKITAGGGEDHASRRDASRRDAGRISHSEADEESAVDVDHGFTRKQSAFWFTRKPSGGTEGVGAGMVKVMSRRSYVNHDLVNNDGGTTS